MKYSVIFGLLLTVVLVCGCSQRNNTFSNGSSAPGCKDDGCDQNADLLVIVSPQYSGESKISEALSTYASSVRDDIGWETKVVLLNPSTNTIGGIRAIIKENYGERGTRAVLIIGEDTATPSAGETENIDGGPTTLIWEELNQPINYGVLDLSEDGVWVYPDPENWVCDECLIQPEIAANELNALLSPQGKRVDLIGNDILRPDVLVSLLYPPVEYNYGQKVDKIVSALQKFSTGRGTDYGTLVQYFKWEETAAALDIDAFGVLGNFQSVGDCNQNCILNFEEKYVLFVAAGHANPAEIQISPNVQISDEDAQILYSDRDPIISAVEIGRLRTPFFIGNGCNITGWYSTKNPNGRLDPISRTYSYTFDKEGLKKVAVEKDLIVEQIFNSENLRLMMLIQSAVSTVRYGRFAEALKSGKPIAEAYLDGNMQVNQQVFYGDPSFHYNS